MSFIHFVFCSALLFPPAHRLWYVLPKRRIAQWSCMKQQWSISSLGNRLHRNPFRWSPSRVLIQKLFPPHKQRKRSKKPKTSSCITFKQAAPRLPTAKAPYQSQHCFQWRAPSRLGGRGRPLRATFPSTAFQRGLPAALRNGSKAGRLRMQIYRCWL